MSVVRTLARIVVAPVGMLVGIAMAFVIGGAASDWHPDVGGALGISALAFVLGAVGLAVGLWLGFRS